ncbi:MAG: FHA domain-containing protein [Victivallales bacterium]|nr:FHA domain-containing protein [Victivallales bacterium]MCF7888949.1 FHA domain-containing protein [Victivallales bacterium]
MEEKVPKLKILSSESRGKALSLNKKELTCGRAKSNDLVLDDSSISSKHCKFIGDEMGYTVKDEGSTNGTFVNNIKITNKSLKDEDIITLGNVEMLYDSGYFKQKKEKKKSSKAAISLGNDQINIPVGEMQNFSPFAKKKNSKLFFLKRLMLFVCVGLVIFAAGLLIYILFSSV